MCELAIVNLGKQGKVPTQPNLQPRAREPKTPFSIFPPAAETAVEKRLYAVKNFLFHQYIAS